VILDRLTQGVGRTPQVRLRSLEREAPGVEIWAKLEWFNPGGSVKDRAALAIIEDAITRGLLVPGGRRALLDSTSGNTGIAYAWIGAALKIPIALVMPSNVSEARKQLTRFHGARQIFSDPQELSDGAIVLARKLAAEEPERFYYADQYSNPANPAAHLATADEIWRDTGGRVTHAVIGLGTTGTCMGTGRGLRAHNPAIEVIAIEPAEPLHGLEGLKHLASSIVPPIYRPEDLSETLLVTTDEGWDMAEHLRAHEGLLAGHSAGAAALGALRVASALSADGRTGCVVTIFPDKADRYLPPAR
jgi:S-sulfo-L-cysteine synthase (O-acetyl-L-serine-dependent)